MSRLQRVLSRWPPKDGDPAPPCPTLPLPPAKKKERPACRRQGEDGREARGGSMPAVLGGRGAGPRGALAGPPRRGGGWFYRVKSWKTSLDWGWFSLPANKETPCFGGPPRASRA